MASTKINLRQAIGRVFTFGANTAGNDALVTIEKGTQTVGTVVLDVKGSQNLAGDLNVTGKLNITGGIDQANVTNLAVVDKNITLNKGGTTGGASAAGLNIEGTSGAVIAALAFDSTKISKFNIGDGTIQNEIVVSSNSPSTAGRVLMDNGTGLAPSFQTLPTNSAYFRSTTVSGTQDGTNTAFTIGNAVSAASEQVFVNGILMNPGASNDYTLSGTTITFVAAGTVRVYGVY